MKNKPFILKLGLGAIIVLLSLAAPHTLAQTQDSPPWQEETIFLGEFVPLRREGRSLVELAAETLDCEPQELELSWESPQGQAPLEELGHQRPTSGQEYTLNAALTGKNGTVRYKKLVYQVHVVTGTVQVQALGGGSAMLFCLEGQGLTLYRQALPDPDPQGGAAVLTAEFTGLPYGVYTVTALEGGDGEQVCRLGVCREDDTVDPERHRAVLRFAAGENVSPTVGESYRLGGRA